MSYSFRVQGATKALALNLVVAQMNLAAQAQACHQRDSDQAIAAAKSFIELLPDDDSKDVVVHMSGSLTGRWDGSDVVLIEGASFSVSAGLVTRATPATA